MLSGYAVTHGCEGRGCKRARRVRGVKPTQVSCSHNSISRVPAVFAHEISIEKEVEHTTWLLNRSARAHGRTWTLELHQPYTAKVRRSSLAPPHIDANRSLPRARRNVDSLGREEWRTVQDLYHLFAGLQVARGNVAFSVMCVQWFADSSNALNVAAFRARFNSNAVMAGHARQVSVGAKTKVSTKHVDRHAETLLPTPVQWLNIF